MSAEVLRLWPNSTIVCLASGPSLTQDDVDYVRGKARVIVINKTVSNAPWADVLYGADEKVWRWYDEMRTFPGLKYSLTRGSAKYGATVLRRGLVDGLSLNPEVLCGGQNSGYQAIGLAVLLGAVRIILLGYDMQRGPNGEEHHHAEHPNNSRSPYETYRRRFDALVEPLHAAKVEVINCTRRTALTCFPQMDLRKALPETSVVAA